MEVQTDKHADLMNSRLSAYTCSNSGGRYMQTLTDGQLYTHIHTHPVDLVRLYGGMSNPNPNPTVANKYSKTSKHVSTSLRTEQNILTKVCVAWSETRIPAPPRSKKPVRTHCTPAMFQIAETIYEQTAQSKNTRTQPGFNSVPLCLPPPPSNECILAILASHPADRMDLHACMLR